MHPYGLEDKETLENNLRLLASSNEKSTKSAKHLYSQCRLEKGSRYS